MRLSLLIPTLGLALSLAACASQSYPPQAAPQSGNATPTAAPAPATQSAAAPAAEASEAEIAKPDLGETLSPPDAYTRAEPGEAPASAEVGSGWVSKYPYGTASDQAASEAAAVAPAAGTDATGTGAADTASGSEPTVQVGSTGWIKAEVTAEEHQADIEACYRYAFSQVEHDFRIDDDVAAARPGDSDNGLGFTALTNRMNLYDQRNRRTELINRCMEGKGYNQV